MVDSSYKRSRSKRKSTAIVTKITDFANLEKLADGKHGDVWLARQADILFAIKTFSKQKLIDNNQQESALKEKEMLKEMIGEPFIV